MGQVVAAPVGRWEAFGDLRGEVQKQLKSALVEQVRVQDWDGREGFGAVDWSGMRKQYDEDWAVDWGRYLED